MALVDGDPAPFVLRTDEPLVGVRGFLLSGEGELCSVVMPLTWPKASVGPAICYSRPDGDASSKWYAARDPSIPDHAAPRGDCKCGFCAYHPGALVPLSVSAFSLSSASVLGVVIGYGMVLPGTKGWRASHARVMALLLPGAPTPPWAGAVGRPDVYAPADRIKQVAADYGVAVMRREDVPRMAPEFGQVAPYREDPPRRQHPG